MALATSALSETVVVDGESAVARTTVPVATSASLIALKAIAIPHRSQSRHPAKVGSDIHDLVRLVQSCDRSDVVGSISESSAELSDWVGTTLIKWFSPEQDLRLTFARLQNLTRSPDAQALDQDDLAAVGELGRALIGPTAAASLDHASPTLKSSNAPHFAPSRPSSSVRQSSCLVNSRSQVRFLSRALSKNASSESGDLHRWMQVTGHDGRSQHKHPNRWRFPSWHRGSASR